MYSTEILNQIMPILGQNFDIEVRPDKIVVFDFYKEETICVIKEIRELGFYCHIINKTLEISSGEKT